MSHVTSGACKITDLQALKEAIQKHFPQLKWKEGQKTYRWYGHWAQDYSNNDAAYKRLGLDPADYGKCEHAIEVAGSGYDIGVVKTKQGHYALVWDFWGTGARINEVIGAEGAKLQMAYSRTVVHKKAKQYGYSVYEQQQKNGGWKYQLTKMY